MVTLHLKQDRGGPGQTMTDRRFLELEINQWLRSPERRRQLEAEAYYLGDQAAAHRRRTALDDGGRPVELKHLPNNRLVDNLYAKMVDQKVNYSLGKPFSFDTQNGAYAAALEGLLGERFRRTLRAVGEGAVLEGQCWLCPYYAGGELAFRRIPAHQVLPFWADAGHTLLDAAVHLYTVSEYGEREQAREVTRAEVFHGGGVDCFLRREDGTLVHEGGSPYITETDPGTGSRAGYNWTRIPLVCFKSSHRELPLLSRVKCLQDAYNSVLSNFANQMEEDLHSTVLVIKNYDGEDLGRFRQNLAQYGVIKVRSCDGCDGGVDTLSVQVNAENYKTLLSLLKDAIVENARGYNARDDRLGYRPNQMNILSMYSDIDLDANSLELEFQAGMEELLWFVNQHLYHAGLGDFRGERARIIFDRDLLLSETEVIENCVRSAGLLSRETLVKMHPWISEPERELERLRQEKIS